MLPRRLVDPKPTREKRIRSDAHLTWVRGFGCIVPGCDLRPIEAAHVRSGTGGGVGIKPGDDWVVSLCRDHHNHQHRVGEPAFETEFGIDMKQLAREFAAKSPHKAKLRPKVRACCS